METVVGREALSLYQKKKKRMMEKHCLFARWGRCPG